MDQQLDYSTRDDIHQIGMVTYILYGIAAVVSPVAIVGVIYAYLKRPEVAGSFAESHMTWLIRTFWMTLAFGALGCLLVLSIIGLLVAWLVFFITGVFYIYRIVKGFVTFYERQPMADPESWF